MLGFEFSSAPLDPERLREPLADPACGGYATFEGWVRDHNDGRSVRKLEYEAYVELAVKEGERIVAEAVRRFGVQRARCVHRVGSLELGELAVWVGVSAGLPDGASVAQTRAGAMRWLAVALNLTTMERPVSFTITAVRNGQRVDTVLVEVGDTDAEGRLILADALALACEEKPALLVNFATLTGAARVALGVDIPVIFSNNEKLAFTLKDVGMANDDPLWPLPLWQPYRKDMTSDIADISSTGSGKAGAITAALFLESFFDPKVDWIHIDLYAWDHGGKPGRTKGGTEMASRALFAYLQNRFGKK